MACQWDAAVVTPIASDKLWITVSEDGAKTRPGQQVIVKVLTVYGAKVTQVVWNVSMDAHAISDGFRQNSCAVPSICCMETSSCHLNYPVYFINYQWSH